MARKPRIEFAGAFYHVITRGNQRQRVFKDPGDYQRYLKILVDYKDRYDFGLYAYVLMSNHVHLLIETKEVVLSRILQGVNQSYTMYFNKKYDTVGHLFQGRYKAILCDKDAYLLSLVKYIHLNPIRVRVVRALEAYPWSSHHIYIAGSDGNGLVDVEKVLGMFSEDRGRARRAYPMYMRGHDVLKREDVYATVDQRILGDEGFVNKMMVKVGKGEIRGRRRKACTLAEIGRAVEKGYGATLSQLREKGRQECVGGARKVMSLVAKEYGYRGQEIGEYLWRDPSVITRYLRERERYGAEVERLHQLLEQKVNKQV